MSVEATLNFTRVTQVILHLTYEEKQLVIRGEARNPQNSHICYLNRTNRNPRRGHTLLLYYPILLSLHIHIYNRLTCLWLFLQPLIYSYYCYIVRFNSVLGLLTSYSLKWTSEGCRRQNIMCYKRPTWSASVIFKCNFTPSASWKFWELRVMVISSWRSSSL